MEKLLKAERLAGHETTQQLSGKLGGVLDEDVSGKLKGVLYDREALSLIAGFEPLLVVFNEQLWPEGPDFGFKEVKVSKGIL